MHDLRQLAADAENVSASLFHYKRDGEMRPEERLAAFVRDQLDETPADAKWLDIVYQPRDDGWGRFQVYKNGSCYFCSRDTASTFIGLFVTRGRVRAFALALGLELKEEPRT